MGILALVGFFIALPFTLQNDPPALEVIFIFFDLITTTVPPSLPACIGIGISYSLSRLKAAGIICINRERVNVAEE